MAEDTTSQAQVRAALPRADSVVILLRTGGKEQQFDGSWLRAVLQATAPLGDASVTTDDAPVYGEQPA